jgi:hypothetical protein
LGGAAAVSGGLQPRLFHRLGHLDEHKTRGRAAVVCATLINDTQIAVPGSLLIREYPVDLVSL